MPTAPSIAPVYLGPPEKPAPNALATIIATTASASKRVVLFTKTPPFAQLEAEVLQRLGRPPVQTRGLTIVASPCGQVADRDPGGSPVACR